LFYSSYTYRVLHSFPTRRSSDLVYSALFGGGTNIGLGPVFEALALDPAGDVYFTGFTQTQSLPVVKPIQRTLNGPQNAFVGELRSEEHTSELQSPYDLVCRLLLE